MKTISFSINQIISLYKSLVTKYASLYGVPEYLVYAIIKIESNGNQFATGATPDIGLMQITNPALTDFNRVTGKNYSLFNLYNPNKNIEVGVWYLAYLKSITNSTWYEVTKCYNVGIGNWQKDKNNGSEYADKVDTAIKLQSKP